MKTKEELNAQKEEVKAESKQRRELTDEELAQVSGGGSRKTIMGAKKKMCPLCNTVYAGSETHCTVPTCYSAQLVSYEE